MDSQTLNGKAVSGVAAAAYGQGVPVIAIVGSTGPGAADCADSSRGGFLERYVSLAERFGEDRALLEAEALIEQLAREVVAAKIDRNQGAIM